MAGAGYSYRNIPSPSSPNIINKFPEVNSKFLFFHNPQATTISITRASAVRKNDSSLVPGKKTKPRIITISTSEGKWHDKWNCEYKFSLLDLQLHDLVEDIEKDTIIYLNLCIEKHAGLGLSLEGKITTCFTTKCCNCCSPYLRQISTTLKVWVLPSTRRSKDSSNSLPDIYGDDPSVIYVKPGYEADISSLVQDTIRLATSVNETCSEYCEKSEPQLQHVGELNTASIDKRWHKLLELKKRREIHTHNKSNKVYPVEKFG